MFFRSMVIISIHRDLVHVPGISMQHFTSFPLSKMKKDSRAHEFQIGKRQTHIRYHITVFSVPKKLHLGTSDSSCR